MIEREEIWKFIENTDSKYMISNNGRIKSLINGERFLVQSIDKKTGYYTINLRINNKERTVKIHSLMGKYFLPENSNPKKQVNHKDLDKLNNFDWNLEWNTNRENSSHSKLMHGKKTSKYVGVSYSAPRRKWCALIEINGKSINLGRYLSEEEARDAYQTALITYGLTNKYATAS